MILRVAFIDLLGPVERLEHEQRFLCKQAHSNSVRARDRCVVCNLKAVRAPSRRETSHAAIWVAMRSAQYDCSVVRYLRASPSGSAARIISSPSGSVSAFSLDLSSGSGAGAALPLPFLPFLACSFESFSVRPASQSIQLTPRGASAHALSCAGVPGSLAFAALASALRFLLIAFLRSFSGK